MSLLNVVILKFMNTCEQWGNKSSVHRPVQFWIFAWNWIASVKMSRFDFLFFLRATCLLTLLFVCLSATSLSDPSQPLILDFQQGLVEKTSVFFFRLTHWTYWFWPKFGTCYFIFFIRNFKAHLFSIPNMISAVMIFEIYLVFELVQLFLKAYSLSLF